MGLRSGWRIPVGDEMGTRMHALWSQNILKEIHPDKCKAKLAAQGVTVEGVLGGQPTLGIYLTFCGFFLKRLLPTPYSL